MEKSLEPYVSSEEKAIEISKPEQMLQNINTIEDFLFKYGACISIQLEGIFNLSGRLLGSIAQKLSNDEESLTTKELAFIYSIISDSGVKMANIVDRIYSRAERGQLAVNTKEALKEEIERTKGNKKNDIVNRMDENEKEFAKQYLLDKIHKYYMKKQNKEKRVK